MRDGEAPSAVAQGGDDVYTKVFDAWENETRLAAALADVCEYHCRNIDNPGGAWVPEFTDAPFDLLPCEVMLVRQVREQLGITTPKVKHQLMSTLQLEDTSVPEHAEHEFIPQIASLFKANWG